MKALYILSAALGLIYALWILYLAVMNLKQAHDTKKMTLLAYVLATPIVKVGLLLDVLVNVFVFTILLLELPKTRLTQKSFSILGHRFLVKLPQVEFLVTARLKRHNREGRGWRKAFATWCEQFLDPFDPSGDHI